MEIWKNRLREIRESLDRFEKLKWSGEKTLQAKEELEYIGKHIDLLKKEEE